jgi:2-polyprenyl-3-methyl-5-hydroxy-6-metoxy-1,4-benzoquinol methylase
MRAGLRKVIGGMDAALFSHYTSGNTKAIMQATNRVCPLCEEARQSEWLRKGGLRLAQCASCGMVFANPVAEEFATGMFYDRESSYYLSEAKLASDYSPSRFERELRLFRRYCAGGEVLDVGCSTGAFLFQLKRRWPGTYRVLGTDVAEGALSHAESKGVPVARGPFPQQDFKGRQFDAVTFWAVLEHLTAPRLFLEKAWTLLKPRGVVFVLAPNLQSLAVRLAGARYRYIMPDHVNYFTRATLRRLGEQLPMAVIPLLTSMHFNPVVIFQDWRRGRETRVQDNERAQLLSRTTRWKENRLLRPLKWGYAAVEKGLGRFNLADNLVMVLRKEGPPEDEQ